MHKKLFSIVLPIYKNEKNLPVTVPYIVEHLHLFSDYDIEIIMVCDGSPDRSWEVMKEMKRNYPELIKNYKFNKNYWQKTAITCGIDKACGDVVGVISADLQDPFELFKDMLDKWEEGYKFIGGCREKRRDSGIGCFFSKMYHRFIHKYINENYPGGGCDFFVIDKSLKENFSRQIMKYGSMLLVLLDLTDTPYFINYERRNREIGKSGFTAYKKIYGVITTFVLNTDRLFYWMVFSGIGAGSILFVLSIIFAIADRNMIFVLLGLLGAGVGVTISSLGLLGIAVYNWAQTLRGLPKYVIEDEDI